MVVCLFLFFREQVLWRVLGQLHWTVLSFGSSASLSLHLLYNVLVFGFLLYSASDNLLLLVKTHVSKRHADSPRREQLFPSHSWCLIRLASSFFHRHHSGDHHAAHRRRPADGKVQGDAAQLITVLLPLRQTRVQSEHNFTCDFVLCKTLDEVHRVVAEEPTAEALGVGQTAFACASMAKAPVEGGQHITQRAC